MKRFIRSFSYAANGLWSVLREQRNFKIHLFIALLVISAGFYVELNRGEWMVITIVIGFVFAAELFNTAIEYIVNLISPEHQTAAGKIKDIAAGAVLLAAITALIVGVIVFNKYLPNALMP